MSELAAPSRRGHARGRADRYRSRPSGGAGDHLNPVTLDLPPCWALAGDELARSRRATVSLPSALVPTAAGTGGRNAADPEGARTSDG